MVSGKAKVVAPLLAAHIDSNAYPVNIKPMEMDDNLPLRPNDPLRALAKQDLDPLSIDELHARIAAMKSEIARCEAHIAQASSHRNAAEALFKK
jgi:uncharacterized small protein (DUF1192 family)